MQGIRKTAVYRSLMSYLVPELQIFEDTKIKAKSSDKKQGNQFKSIKIDKICDMTYIACRFDGQLNEPILGNYLLETIESWYTLYNN